MAVPKHLRFFTLFVDGENEVGKVTSVTLPKLTRKTDSYRGGGMMGAVSIDLGLDDSAPMQKATCMKSKCADV